MVKVEVDNAESCTFSLFGQIPNTNAFYNYPTFLLTAPNLGQWNGKDLNEVQTVITWPFVQLAVYSMKLGLWKHIRVVHSMDYWGYRGVDVKPIAPWKVCCIDWP